MTKSVVLMTKFGYDPLNCGRVIDRLTERKKELDLETDLNLHVHVHVHHDQK